jgi:hypothetical protein
MIRIKIPHIRHKRLKGCLAACVLLHSLASAVCLLQWGQRTRDLSLRGHCRFHPGEMKHYNGMRSISATATIALLVGPCQQHPFIIRHRYSSSAIDVDVPRCLSSKSHRLHLNDTGHLLNDSDLHYNISSRMSCSQVIRFHKYIVTPQVFYKTTSSYGIVNMRPLIRE